jgi:hypothetical protein
VRAASHASREVKGREARGRRCGMALRTLASGGEESKGGESCESCIERRRRRKMQQYLSRWAAEAMKKETANVSIADAVECY